MNNDEPNIIPFGKHKGKTVEEVQLYDPNYLDWLTGQSWFRDKFVILHQTIINRGTEPEETPDHNTLQVLFLDDEFCRKVLAAAGRTFPPDVPLEKYRQFEWKGVDVRISDVLIEIKPTVGDDYPAVLRQMKALDTTGAYGAILFLERYTGVGATAEQFEAIFKSAGIRVVYRHQV